MLITLICLPILGSFILGLSNLNESKSLKISESYQKKLALLVSVIVFFLSLLVWYEYDNNETAYQFITTFTFGISNYTSNFNLGIDSISMYYVLLTTFTTPLAILASWNNVNKNVGMFIICLLMLESFLIAVFTVLDIILFYVFFEAVLIPLFFIVGIWGASNERIRASYLLFLYTLFGSLFILLAFIYLISLAGSSDIRMIFNLDLNLNDQIWIWLALFISIGIKTPLLPFHRWLTAAHVEAPVAGSIVLAGLILKLATYGYLRIIIQLLPDASAYFTPLIIMICTITLIYSSLTTLRQTDFKCLVAYSSIAHIAVVLAGLFSNTLIGIEGALILSLAHGFVSPGLFIIVGSILYERGHTRAIRFYRGLTITIPLMSLFFFLFTLANISTPLTANWIGELLSLLGAFALNPYFGIFISTGIVLSAAYSIWLFNRINFGNLSLYITTIPDITRREFHILLALIIPTFLFGIWPNLILDDYHITVTNLLYSL
jgi:NADH-ubiquinone oxidoreductase chain 4